MAGTRWVQRQVLDTHPKADVSVYAVWFAMYPGDARAKWPADLLTDPRVTHRWDEGKLVGRWFADRADAMRPRLAPGSTWAGTILWDSYLLFGREATWTDAPSGLIHWGRTIVAGRRTLQADIDRLFGS